ncbi:MAG TPA: xanthine dehydrogenase accessory protein XdhC [Herbaspirillum sp.]|jgi:xanthine dehydrogenase accessory factor|nr:xanthine dehydrogenase accessory protein XdhC [Herbaspirillum sp.]
MPEWLQALQRLCDSGASAILITVADAQGSTPRAAGARMVVAQFDTFDTIGGGHLEWQAIELAQAILRNADATQVPYTPQLHRFALGPALGQCCGGAVQLLFEKIDPGAHANTMIAALVLAWQQGRDVWRRLPFEPAARAELLDGLPPQTPQTHSIGGMATHVGQTAAGMACLYDYCRSDRPQVLLFGAGHVGRALATLLSALPCRLLWVDEREDLFPAQVPENASIEVTDVPEAVVGNAAAGSYFIVMTHSHALDQRLSERILRRGDAAWFGLIGSETKHQMFLKRLSQRGLSEQQLAGMTCPIGIGGISSKEPSSIAVAVAAQLLQLWDDAGDA